MIELDMSKFESRNPENVLKVKRLINNFKKLGYEVDAYSYHNGESPDYFTIKIDNGEGFYGAGLLVNLYPNQVEIEERLGCSRGTRFSYDEVSIRKTSKGYNLVCAYTQSSGYVTRREKHPLEEN